MQLTDSLVLWVVVVVVVVGSPIEYAQTSYKGRPPPDATTERHVQIHQPRPAAAHM